MNKSHIYRRFLTFLTFSVLIPLLCLSCASNEPAAIDPEKAVYRLSPVTRSAEKPSQGVYYCIFVRSFADSDGDGIGDFRGLTEKLDYLNDGNDSTTDDLGVTGIWLMPMFPSQSYHGYNVDDYYAVNPDYGTMADFEYFLKEADSRGISVIIDMTCNHSSVYTDWFISSRDPDSPYRDWYRWANEDDAGYNLKQKIWGHNVWNKDPKTGTYYAGLFENGMPDFNLANPEVRAEFKKIVSFWMDKGVSGFRFDAAGHVFNSAKLKAGESSQEQAVGWWKEICGYIAAENPDAYNVGEVWEPASTRAVYTAGLKSTFHFDLGTAIVDTIRAEDGGKNNLANMLYGDYQLYAKQNAEYIDAPFLTNHDQNRISGMLKGDFTKLKLAASLYILAEGVPFMYYGEEIGLMGAKPDEQIRTPMLWNAPGKDALQTTWIDSKYNKKTVPVAAQRKDEDSLLQYYKRLIRVKTAHSALYEGRLTPVWTGEPELISWVMESDAERAFVIHNVSSEAMTAALPAEAGAEDLQLVFATYSDTSVSADGYITVSPYGSAVLAASR
ncbi:alpha-amylase family glycosyl hydrolase [Treponema brennaborense]|uniref:Alpha amylase catalytic region n=1 Tax=Treponema brennaborense (strain DSM 12168 / CIP 105900 / DD5/3) TaxID=906968 RepID=F4LQB0_TREBD|nr:alpha-amylase family glycosyl hydrolase [Treponema brennaborense]AEE16131.1 alpha amylase catalytic region [Treponema brennaborense DSM 12168]